MAVFLLVNLNPDFAIENSIFCSIEDQTNLRLQSERSTSKRGAFRLVSRSGLRCLFLLTKTVRLSPKGNTGSRLFPFDIWMDDHLDKIPCAVLHGKSDWRSGHQSRLPPLLQMLYVD